MNVIKSLTKENFWNAIAAKYPEPTKEFCDWIDKYKNTVDWDKLFNSGIKYMPSSGPIFSATTYAPKYHELPYAMQLGIWLEYINSFSDSADYLISITEEYDWVFDLKGMIDCFFAIREEEMKNKKD